MAFLSACVSSPSKLFLSKAEGLGFSESSLATPRFDLKVYARPSLNLERSKKLHVYLDGDGKPFIRNQYIAVDPTSSGDLILELMRLDKTSSVLVGRPCYHQIAGARNCDNKWWTSSRYSPAVVNSMIEAINQITKNANQKITLIGFSGGGALAMLIAAKLESVEKIITINANLDTDAWVRQHNYSSLVGSLNPIEALDAVKAIPQHHLVGANDSNVDSSQWSSKVGQYDNANVTSFPNFTHLCCWADIWSEFINK